MTGTVARRALQMLLAVALLIPLHLAGISPAGPDPRQGRHAAVLDAVLLDAVLLDTVLPGDQTLSHQALSAQSLGDQALADRILATARLLGDVALLGGGIVGAPSGQGQRPDVPLFNPRAAGPAVGFVAGFAALLALATTLVVLLRDLGTAAGWSGWPRPVTTAARQGRAPPHVWC